MAVPKQHRSSSRRDQRRMHLFLKARNFVACKNCKKPVLPHTLCAICGMYADRKVVDVMAKLSKKEKKAKEKELSQSDKQ